MTPDEIHQYSINAICLHLLYIFTIGKCLIFIIKSSVNAFIRTVSFIINQILHIQKKTSFIIIFTKNLLFWLHLHSTLNEFKGKKVSVYFSNSKHSQQSFAAPRS